MFTHPMIAIITGMLLLVSVVISRAWIRRRGRDDDRFNLGAVSQQWLVVHKGDER
jgi:hypothetical protein